MPSFRLGLALCITVLAHALQGQTATPRLTLANAAQPQLAVSNDGRIWIVYGNLLAAPAKPAENASHHGHGPASRTGEVYVASSSDDGATFSPAGKFGPIPQLMLGSRRGPRLAVHANRITVTVIGQELLCYVSADGGAHWSQPVTINSVPGSAREGLHDLALAPDGRLFVTWLDLRNGAMELWGAESRDGGSTWSANLPVYRSPEKSICECCHPSALFDADGNLAVMWRNSLAGARDMWMTTRVAGASTFSAAQKIGPGSWPLQACPMDGGRLLALGHGRFGAVWQRQGNIYLSRDAGTEELLGPGKQPVAVVQRNGELEAVWQHNTDLVTWNSRLGPAPSRSIGGGRAPVLVSLPRGPGLLLAYEQGPRENPAVVIERR